MPSTPPTRLIRFTVPSLKAIPHPLTGSVIYRDEKCDGLFLKVTSTRKSYCLRRWVSGRVRKATIGAFPGMTPDAARVEANRVMVAMREGVDPGEQRRKAREESKRASSKDPTFAELWATVKREILPRTCKPATAHNYEFNYNHLKPLENRKLSTIHFDELRDLHRTIGETRPAMANAVMVLAASLYRVAGSRVFTGPLFRVIKSSGRTKMGWGSVGENGCILFPEKPRTRRLSVDEDIRFRSALTRLRDEALTLDPKLDDGVERKRAGNESVAYDYFTLLYRCGIRKSSGLRMQWDQIEWAGKTAIWRIPADQVGQKSKGQVVALDEEITAILRERRGLVPRTCRWVFPSVTSTPSEAGHLSEGKRGWNRLLAAAGIDGLTMHDLRRSIAYRLREAGASDREIGSALNHAEGSRITGTNYDRIASERLTGIMAAANAGSAPPDTSQPPTDPGGDAPAVLAKIGEAAA